MGFGYVISRLQVSENVTYGGSKLRRKIFGPGARFFAPANVGWPKHGPAGPQLVPARLKGKSVPFWHLGGAPGPGQAIMGAGTSGWPGFNRVGLRHKPAGWKPNRGFGTPPEGMDVAPKRAGRNFFFFQFSAGAGRPRVPRDMFPKGKPDQARGEPAVPAQSENRALRAQFSSVSRRV